MHRVKPAARPRVERAPAVAGPDLLQRIRPHMRRSRQGNGGSGSLSFLSRALKCGESDLLAAFNAIGLALPASAEDKPIRVEFGSESWWLHRDHRGAVWISGEGSRCRAFGAPLPLPRPDAAPRRHRIPVRPLRSRLRGPIRCLPGCVSCSSRPRTGSLAGKVGTAWPRRSPKAPRNFLATLTAQGLKVPEKPKEKPAFVEDGTDIFWLNRNAKGELWLNVKASKFAVGEDPPKKKSRRSASET